MKKILVFNLLVLIIGLSSCSKIEEVNETPITGGTVLYKGVFSSAAHPTSGDIEVVKLDAKNVLSFKNFKTDAGPDLRVYLSQDLGAKNFVEVSNKVNNGTYTLDLPSTLDPKSNKYVLIWCKQFSVLFGSAELK
jgi:hypothetical protein